MEHIKTFDLRKPVFSSYSYKFKDNLYNNSIINGIVFNQINIFVGENNSGKSRFLRALFANNNMVFADTEALTKTFYEIDSKIEEIVREISGSSIVVDDILNKRKNYSEIINIHSGDLNEIKKYNFKDPSNQSQENIEEIIYYFNGIQEKIIIALDSGAYNDSIYQFSRKVIDEIQSLVNFLELFVKDHRVDVRYIPIFRGLKPLSREGSAKEKNEWVYQNLYKERVYYEYFERKYKPELKGKIFTGQDFYELIKNRLLGIKEDRSFINDYEDYLSNNFFEGKEVSIYPNDNQKIVLIKIGEDEERPIHDLGDGIQSIIILTFELFANKNTNMIFFIEEPEIYLHPKYQRRLIETFKKEEFSNFQFFITTHSNHFLDLVFDYEGISIFTFISKAQNGKIVFEIEKVLDDSFRPYEMLGIRNSSLLLSNCTIWVEGISDKVYINKYLDLYMGNIGKKGKFKEDIHFTYIEYGGNNIVHWNFIEDEDHLLNFKAITKNVFIVADNDFTKSAKKLERQRKMREIMGEKFYLLNVREIENTISLPILRETIAEFKGKDRISPVLNEKVKSEKAYAEEYLGSFIDKNINTNKKFATNEKAGTIREKFNFSRVATQKMQNYEDLSEEAKKLAQEIYLFVERSNNYNNKN